MHPAGALEAIDLCQLKDWKGVEAQVSGCRQNTR